MTGIRILQGNADLNQLSLYTKVRGISTSRRTRDLYSLFWLPPPECMHAKVNNLVFHFKSLWNASDATDLLICVLTIIVGKI